MNSKPELEALADRIERRLKRAGVRVTRYTARTGSVYMWLDEGLAYSMRISDHEGPLHHRYRYNVLTCPIIHKRTHAHGIIRYYYAPEDFFKMIHVILAVRKSRMASWGAKKYQAIMSVRKVYNQNLKEK